MEHSEYIKIKSGRRLAIRVEGVSWKDVTISDVIKYFKHEAHNLVSGCRTLGTITGDWRPIDNLAQECLCLFKELNIKGLRNTAKKEGLVPKF